MYKIVQTVRSKREFSPSIFFFFPFFSLLPNVLTESAGFRGLSGYRAAVGHLQRGQRGDREQRLRADRALHRGGNRSKFVESAKKTVRAVRVVNKYNTVLFF